MRRLYLECNLRDTQNIYSLTGMPASAWFLQRQVPFLLMHCQINTTLISSRSLITRVTLFIRQDQCHGSVPDYPLGPAIVNLVCNLDKIRNRCCPLIFGLTAITMPCFCVCLWAVLISELSGIKKKTRLFHLSADEIALLSILLCFSIGRLAKKIHINNFFFFFRYEAFIEKSKWISICFKSNTKKNDLPLIMSTPFWPLRSSQPKRTSPTSAQDWRFSASCWQCCRPQPSWLTSSHSSGASLRAWPAAIPKCYVLSTPFFLVSWVSSQLSLVSCNDLFLNSHWKPDQLHTGKNTIYLIPFWEIVMPHCDKIINRSELYWRYNLQTCFPKRIKCWDSLAWDLGILQT